MMATEATVKRALENYLRLCTEPDSEVTSSYQFDTGNVLGRVKRGLDLCFVAITEDLYDDWPDAAPEIEEWLKNNTIYEKMQGHGQYNALFVTTRGITYQPLSQRKFDIIGYDKSGRPAFVVELKRSGSQVARERFIEDTKHYMTAASPHASFFMIVDPRIIEVFKNEGGDWQSSFTISALVALVPYDERYGKDPIYEHYLASLVDAWLRDLAYNWHSNNPPGTAQFSEAGLLQALRHSSTLPDASI